MRRPIDLTAATWRRSSYSNSDGGQCLEVADRLPVLLVRDTKNPDIPALVFPAPAWASFVAAVRNCSKPCADARAGLAS